MQPNDPLFDVAHIAAWGRDVGAVGLVDSAWGWAIAESIHFCGICLLFAAVAMFDLRLMGLVRGISLPALHRLVPLGVLGFLLCVTSGTLFVLTQPGLYLYNPAWQIKMLLLLIAGINMVLFYVTAFRRVSLLRPDATPALAARVFGAVSVLGWVGAVAAGRVITAFRPPGYFWCVWCQS
jgi:hypothetical protein